MKQKYVVKYERIWTLKTYFLNSLIIYELAIQSGHTRVLDAQVKNASKHQLANEGRKWQNLTACLSLYCVLLGFERSTKDISSSQDFGRLSKPRKHIRSCFIHFPKLQLKRSMQNANADSK